MKALAIEPNGKPARRNTGVKHKNKEKFSAWLFLIPALLVFALFKYYPIFMGFFISLFDINIVELPGKFVGFANYKRAFIDPRFYAAMLNNVRFFMVGLAINFWPPIFLAMLINEVRKGKVFFRMMYFLPAVAPGVAIAVLWKYIWQPDYGFANYLLGLMNIEPQMWLNDPKMVIWCMYFPGLIMAGGMNLLIYLAALQDVPEERFESAMIEGAGIFNRIRYITMPQIFPIIKIMFVLDIIGRFNEAGTPFIMTGGGPVGASETMILYAYKAALTNLDYSYAITLANIVFVIIFIVTAIQMKVSAKKE